jgi:tRNA-dihydrouridine synthase C
VRRAVPAGMPVSAKMRLGVDDDVAHARLRSAIASAGAASWWCTPAPRLHGYRPPAYWERIAAHPRKPCVCQVRVVANGEVWSVADAALHAARSGCDALMLGARPT